MLLLLLAGIMVSCGSKAIYREFVKFPDNVWSAENVPQFTVTVENDTSNYDMFLAFRYVHGYPLTNASMTITETDPDGNTQMHPVTVEIRKDDGTYIGDGSGDIWDVEHKIKSNVKLKKGNYSFSIEQEIAEKLPMVMEVGLILRDSE